MSRNRTAAPTDVINPAALPNRQLTTTVVPNKTAGGHIALPPKAITRRKAAANTAKAIASRLLNA
ncbi:hypothetical protein [Acidicapsa ligni]|uniref:hypothetical protein n=1 Tax=Acidicapsa ligni TaxID=542300 RepID=UPI0021E0D1A6|nr:hypothetical protein [Acidicapsa ligni]